jgi:hypothetical protein
MSRAHTPGPAGISNCCWRPAQSCSSPQPFSPPFARGTLVSLRADLRRIKLPVIERLGVGRDASDTRHSRRRSEMYRWANKRLMHCRGGILHGQLINVIREAGRRAGLRYLAATRWTRSRGVTPVTPCQRASISPIAAKRDCQSETSS